MSEVVRVLGKRQESVILICSILLVVAGLRGLFLYDILSSFQLWGLALIVATLGIIEVVLPVYTYFFLKNLDKGEVDNKHIALIILWILSLIVTLLELPSFYFIESFQSLHPPLILVVLGLIAFAVVVGLKTFFIRLILKPKKALARKFLFSWFDLAVLLVALLVGMVTVLPLYSGQYQNAFQQNVQGEVWTGFTLKGCPDNCEVQSYRYISSQSECIAYGLVAMKDEHSISQQKTIQDPTSYVCAVNCTSIDSCEVFDVPRGERYEDLSLAAVDISTSTETTSDYIDHWMPYIISQYPDAVFNEVFAVDEIVGDVHSEGVLHFDYTRTFFRNSIPTISSCSGGEFWKDLESRDQKSIKRTANGSSCSEDVNLYDYSSGEHIIHYTQAKSARWVGKCGEHGFITSSDHPYVDFLSRILKKTGPEGSFVVDGILTIDDSDYYVLRQEEGSNQIGYKLELFSTSNFTPFLSLYFGQLNIEGDKGLQFVDTYEVYEILPRSSFDDDFFTPFVPEGYVETDACSG